MYQRLAHSSWDCKYHVVFVPKRRRKVLFGQARMKGKSAHLCGKERNFTGEHFWARGYAVSTVGLSWSKCANTSANKSPRRRALARRLNQRDNRL
jgi:REP element-mobilizing transposase RayT